MARIAFRRHTLAGYSCALGGAGSNVFAQVRRDVLSAALQARTFQWTAQIAGGAAVEIQLIRRCFASDGPRTYWRRRPGGIIWRPCARTSWCRSRSHCRLFRRTIDCERLGFKTIKLSPAAGGARSKCKLQIAVCTAKRSLCSNASSGGAAACSNKRIRSTTRATARVRRRCVPSRQPVCSKLYNKSAA